MLRQVLARLIGSRWVMLSKTNLKQRLQPLACAHHRDWGQPRVLGLRQQSQENVSRRHFTFKLPLTIIFTILYYICVCISTFHIFNNSAFGRYLLEDISQNAKQCKPSSPVFHQLTSDMSICHNYVKYTNKSAEAENLGGFSGHIFASLARIQFEDVRPPLNLSPPSHLLTRSSSSIVLFAHFVKMSKAVAAAFLASLQQTRWKAKFLCYDHQVSDFNFQSVFLWSVSDLRIFIIQIQWISYHSCRHLAIY